jgi:DNA-binding NarL/FixJ family response regulator
VARGLDNADIAATLFISARTVKNHLASIYSKLDVDDKTKALVRALRLGIVEIE